MASASRISSPVHPAASITARTPRLLITNMVPSFPALYAVDSNAIYCVSLGRPPLHSGYDTYQDRVRRTRGSTHMSWIILPQHSFVVVYA